MSDDTAVAEVKVSADGSDWRDISPPLQSVDVEDHDRLTDKATIVLDDHTGVLADAGFEGLEVRVTIGWQDEKATIFEGVVSAARAISREEGHRVEVTAYDFTYRMSRHTPDPPMQWHNGEKLSEVLQSIVGRAEYDIVPFQIEPAEDVTYGEDNPLRQANTNDWDFVQTLADRHLCRAFVEFDGEAASKFYFVPIARLASAEPVGLMHCCRGLGDLVSFETERISSGSLVQWTASAVDPVSGETVTHESPEPQPRPPLPPPSTERRDLSDQQRAAVEALVEVAAAAEARQEAARERVTTQASDPAAAAATVIRDPTLELGLRGRGVATGTVMLRAKSRVRISGIPTWAEGDWYLKKVNHVYTRQRIAGGAQRAGYVTNFEATR